VLKVESRTSVVSWKTRWLYCIVFGSKRSAICALAVYFVHLTTLPKIPDLMSGDSIVDRQFVTDE